MHSERSSTTIALPALDYLQASPVRGQLEPRDEVTNKPGWRFLQCTDTPNELKSMLVLKVLLPPRTAQFYAVLLKAELNELAKQRDASWDHIVDIRRLKDRMIRKCQRLAQTYSGDNQAARVPFRTLHAPPDFRLKEMEKWIRLQEGSDSLFKKKKSSDGLKPRPSFCCDRCANLVPHNHTVSHRRASTHSVHSRRSSSASEWAHMAGPPVPKRTKASRVNQNEVTSKSSSSSVARHDLRSQESRTQEIYVHEHDSVRESTETRLTNSRELSLEDYRISSANHRSTSVEANVLLAETDFKRKKRDIHAIPEDPHEYSVTSSNRSASESHHEAESIGRLSIISPDPVPIPYNGSLSAVFKDTVTSPVDINDLRDQGRLSPLNGSHSPPSEEETVDGMPRPEALRRRSSLKRSNSELRMSMAYSAKTVSWAMDRDWSHQVSQYHAAAEQVDFVDQELGVIRDKCMEELAGLKALRRNVTETLSKLSLETQRLQREDEVIRDQEEKLRMGFEQLEQKHVQYQAKVKAVLHETEQVLAFCGSKRSGES
ncbi:hypothetical protein F5141DRAFT_1288328 [Pisolithus sp. B1]|nr:hypothetical protein F5141DRAFT_1288328 [Pisolithus sp. B1]